jgi:hypothetical protein
MMLIGVALLTRCAVLVTNKLPSKSNSFNERILESYLSARAQGYFQQ